VIDGLFSPLWRALLQLDDRAFLSVVAHSVFWSALFFLGIHAAAIWAVHGPLALHGWWAWGADALGAVGASLLALWLFMPVAAAIGTLFIERIARAVERRWYPGLPPGQAASLAAQAWDGVAVALRILGLNVIALLLALFIPGLGLIAAWAIGAFAFGRGLFVAVAMRRMLRGAAEALYRRNRAAVLAQGGVLALASYVPALNLLIPVIGTAAMVHVLDRALAPGSDGVHRR